MTEEQITELAKYLTDNRRVIQNSVGMEKKHRDDNEDPMAFFNLRNVFNIHGYPSFDEARETIRSSIQCR